MSAFDVMSWNFIENCLHTFNFGQKIIKMFRCLNKNTFSRIVYNGHASKEIIRLERGCRQGDPVSCYFFIIGAEILANRIRQNQKICGMKLREARVKILQYADDTTFFLDGTETSLREVFDELGWFAKFSGLKPNVSKSNGMWIGNESLRTENICSDIEINWVKEIKLLGIIFEPECVNIIEKNISAKKEKILRTIRMWQNRHLTLAGRVIIAKSLLLPQITHVLSSLPDPSERTIGEISNILFTYIWGSKRNPIKRIRLCQTLINNGLSMIDIGAYVKSLKMKWIKRILEGKDATWCHLLPTKIRTNCIWNFGTVALKKLVQNIDNPFWKDVITAWTSFSKSFSVTNEDVYNENIFNSDVTRFKAIRYSSWEKKGVKFIGDLFENGRLMPWSRFKEKYNINCIQFEYESLILSLPRFTRSDPVERTYQQPVLPARLQYLLSNTTFASYFSRISANHRRGNSNDMDRIKSKWNRDIEAFEPLSVFNIKKSVFTSRYVSFQYKLVMRILTTNTFLKIIGVQENDFCSFCRNEPETLKHLFLTCSYVEKLWNDIADLLRVSRVGQLSSGVKIFGEKNSALINHIITITKYVIYDARRRNARPSIDHFKNLLKQDFETEQYIARKNDELKRFINKWNDLKPDIIFAEDGNH